MVRSCLLLALGRGRQAGILCSHRWLEAGDRTTLSVPAALSSKGVSPRCSRGRASSHPVALTLFPPIAQDVSAPPASWSFAAPSFLLLFTVPRQADQSLH